MHNVRAKRGADAASDHHLLIAKMKLKLKKCTTQSSPRIKYNVGYLNDGEIAADFRI